MKSKLLCLIALLALLFICPAHAQITTLPWGQGPTGQTSTSGSIPAASTLVTLTAPSSNFTLVNYSTSVNLYWSPVSPATTSSFPIAPGGSYTYSGSPLSSFYIIGTAASGTYGVFAN